MLLFMLHDRYFSSCATALLNAVFGIAECTLLRRARRKTMFKRLIFQTALPPFDFSVPQCRAVGFTIVGYTDDNADRVFAQRLLGPVIVSVTMPFTTISSGAASTASSVGMRRITLRSAFKPLLVASALCVQSM